MGTMYRAEDMTPDSLDDVRRLAQNARGFITDLYLHWSAGHYGQAYDDYHICIDKDGSIYIMCDQLYRRKSHTWRRNTNAVGVSLCCCGNAKCYADCSFDLGSEPPTMKQIEVLAQVTAVIAEECDLRLDSDAHVMTHCEAAWKDGYGVPYGGEVNGVKQDDPDLRWDLMKLPDYCGDRSMTDGGNLIRGKAAWYQAEWRGEHRGD